MIEYKVSEDGKTVTVPEGVELILAPATDEVDICKGCYFDDDGCCFDDDKCEDVVPECYTRDGHGIFVKKVAE